jgi:hypothetical protein
MLNKSLLLTSLALCLSFSVAKAQIFSNGEVTGDSSIESVGTVVYAFALGAGTSPEINGVTFSAINPLTTTSPDFSLNSTAVIDGTGGGNLPDGTDGNYSTQLQALVAQGQNLASSTLVLNGLTKGQTYSLELVFDSNQKDARQESVRDTTVGGDDSISGTIVTGGDQGYPNPNANPDPTGAEYITDTFTALGTTETLVGQGGNSQLSGFVVEEVPEPSTWALTGLSLVGAAFLARRKLARS